MNAFNPMTVMHKLEAGGVPHQQAQTIADTMYEAGADLATKLELDAGISSTRDDFKVEMKLLRADFRTDMANLGAAFDAKLNVIAWRIVGSLGTLIILGFGVLGFLITLRQAGGR